MFEKYPVLGRLVSTGFLFDNHLKQDIMERLEFYGRPIDEFYTYRSARCVHSVFIYLSESQVEDLRDYLGSRMSNHVTWKTGNLCYTYSDGILYIGTSIKVMSW